MWKPFPCFYSVTMYFVLGAGFSIFFLLWPLSHPSHSLEKVPVGGLSPGWPMAAPWADSSTLNYPQPPWRANIEWLKHARCVIPSCSLIPAPLIVLLKACLLWLFTSTLQNKAIFGEFHFGRGRIVININITQSLYIFNEIITLSWHFPLRWFQCNITSKPQNWTSYVFRQTSGASDWSQLSFSASG